MEIYDDWEAAPVITMGAERERKFLVIDEDIIQGRPSVALVQGYLAATPAVEVRVRTGPGQILTIKGPRIGDTRTEMEVLLPNQSLAYALLEACDGRVVVKTRYAVEELLPSGEIEHWVVDEYGGDNEGLIIAEYEYDQERPAREGEPMIQPWVGREVTGVQRYYARALATRPFQEWSSEERFEPLT